MAKSKEELDAALNSELEEEINRHMEVVAAITAKYQVKRKANAISEDQSEIIGKVFEEISEDRGKKHIHVADEKTPVLEEGSEDEESSLSSEELVECGDCGKEWSMDDVHCCEQCSTKIVCEECVITCDDCRSHYCKCVREEGSEIKICEDCDCVGGFVCCDPVTKVPCGRQLCGKCVDHHHTAFECNQCYQSRKYGHHLQY